MNAWCPIRTSPTRSGLASMAWYCRLHLIADSTGQLASNDAICIAVAARSPGATNSRYVMPSGRSARRSTSVAEPEAEREQEEHRRDDARDGRPAPYPPVLREEELERRTGAGEYAAHSIKRPAGEVQEHVLERAPANEHALGDEAALVEPVRRRIAVVRVEQHAVGQRLHARDEPVGPAT